MDAACQANPVLRVRAASQASPANQALPEPQAIPASLQLHLASQQLHHPANHAHKDLPDHPAHQDRQETQERLEPQDAQELTLLQAHLDLADLLHDPASQDQLDQTANPAFPPNPSPLFLENPENLATKVHKDPLDHPDHLDKMDHLAHPDQKASLDPMVHLAKMDNLDHLDLLEALELKARRVFARNTALWMVESSSRMAPDDKKFNAPIMDFRLPVPIFVFICLQFAKTY